MEVIQSFMPTTISTYDDNYKQKNNEDNDDKNNFFACTGFTKIAPDWNSLFPYSVYIARLTLLNMDRYQAEESEQKGDFKHDERGRRKGIPLLRKVGDWVEENVAKKIVPRSLSAPPRYASKKSTYSYAPHDKRTSDDMMCSISSPDLFELSSNNLMASLDNSSTQQLLEEFEQAEQMVVKYRSEKSW